MLARRHIGYLAVISMAFAAGFGVWIFGAWLIWQYHWAPGLYLLFGALEMSLAGVGAWALWRYVRTLASH